MGILTRILKILAALMTSNLVSLVTKLLLPPIFLYRYGTTLYGEWIALSGAVAYLSTLNFGIQTYVTQDLTVRYQHHELGAYHLQQSTSLRVLLSILGSAALVCLVVFALPVLAGLQTAVYVLGVVLVLLHIRRVAPEIFPQIGLWDRSAVRAILGPSSYFGLISMSTFLSYEVPVLILQRETGPFVVVVFTVMRTIFSMCRQILNAPTQAMGAEITRLFGRQEWTELTAVYTYSERMIFSAIPVVNLGVLILSPMLLMIWLHKTNLFDLSAYVVMAAISMTLSAKEHKFQFQFSTNTHEQLARIMFFSYVGLAILSVPMVHWLGMLGFLYTWLAVEMFQIVRIIGLNKQLFAHTGQHRLTYVYRLVALCSVGLLIAGVILSHTYRDLYRWQFVAAIGMSAA